jgi:hypothetical protein
MKYFSIALVVLALASSLVAQRCPLAGMETFPGINPAPAPSALTACSRYAEASCCSTGLSDDINAGNDEITRQISQFININTESQCANTVRQAACMQCAGDQYVWASDVTETRYEWRLCKSFCETLLSDCGTSTLISTGDTVSSKYQSGKAFCLDLFSASDASPYVVDDADDKQCFDPTMPPCSMNDVDSYYSTCTDNKRDLYFNWKDTNCAGGIRLPDNKNDLPCPISCGSGTYLPLGASECADCELGTTSSVKKCLTRWVCIIGQVRSFVTNFFFVSLLGLLTLKSSLLTNAPTLTSIANTSTTSLTAMSAAGALWATVSNLAFKARTVSLLSCKFTLTSFVMVGSRLLVPSTRRPTTTDSISELTKRLVSC